MTTTQQHLNQFYVELQAWIDGGCGEHPVFRDWHGICANSRRWIAEIAPDGDGDWSLWEELELQFRADGLDPEYPFARVADSGRKYTNPARLAWIKAHADAAKAAGQEE